MLSSGEALITHPEPLILQKDFLGHTSLTPFSNHHVHLYSSHCGLKTPGLVLLSRVKVYVIVSHDQSALERIFLPSNTIPSWPPAQNRLVCLTRVNQSPINEWMSDCIWTHLRDKTASLENLLTHVAQFLMRMPLLWQNHLSLHSTLLSPPVHSLPALTISSSKGFRRQS